MASKQPKTVKNPPGKRAVLPVKQVKKRKVSFSGARVKGANFEKEVVQIFEENGIPSQRVIGSGAFSNASSDIKIGVDLDEEGNYLPADEGRNWFRIEAKNHANTPEWVFESLSRIGPEAFWKHLEQDVCSKAVMLRRAKVPNGAVKDKDYGKYVGVFMNITDFIKMVKLAYR
ncbi:MAG TPA: hypothetical protein VKR58_06235 [Aquella sp.]|nr:hypothetical protein [Aquella sp.]